MYVKLSFYKKALCCIICTISVTIAISELRMRNLSEICNWKFLLFCVFQIEFTLSCHHFILNDIHDLITFITNKQNTKQIWVGPFQFNPIKCYWFGSQGDSMDVGVTSWVSG